jgi:hypothetical protein
MMSLDIIILMGVASVGGDPGAVYSQHLIIHPRVSWHVGD